MGQHNLLEITLVVICALGGGLFLSRLKHPPILGYILAGILLGPSGFSLISDRTSVEVLAELGVLLLLFSIGLELSLRSFRLIWPLAATATVLQLVGSFSLIWLFHIVLDWSLAYTFLLTGVFALSSTAVAVKMLENIGELRTTTGKIVVAILIAQDLALIPLILVIRNWQASITSPFFWGKIVVAIGTLVALIYLLNRRHRLRLPLLDRFFPHDSDLLPLASLTFCFTSAALAGVVGLSAAYGAFLAGMFLGNTHKRKVVTSAVHPIQSILVMVFFLSVGLLVDLRFVFHNFLTVISLLLALTIVKTCMNVAIFRLLRQPWTRAVLASVVLAHLGEFSFVLVSVGMDSNILDQNGYKLIIAITVLSLLFSPFWLQSGRRLHARSADTLSNWSQTFHMLYGDMWMHLQGFVKSLLPLTKELWNKWRS